MHRHEHEPVILQRDVEAIMVPAGIPVTLRADKTDTSFSAAIYLVAAVIDSR